MKLDKVCINCGSSSNLNISITMDIDGQQYKTVVCDKHESMTLIEVRQKIEDKLNKYKQLLAQMEEFGLSVDDGKDLTIVKNSKEEVTEEQQPRPKPEPKQNIVIANEDGEVVSEKTDKGVRVKKKRIVPKVKIRNVSNQSGMGIKSGQSLDVDRQVREEMSKCDPKDRNSIEAPMTEDVEFQTVQGRAGQPMQIPKKIKHNKGSTTINLVNSGGDAALQRRFKHMAEVSKSEEGKSYGQNGYDYKECTACDGTGHNKLAKGSCPKCGGTGMITPSAPALTNPKEMIHFARMQKR